MLEILLLFAMNDQLAEVSQRTYSSYGECAMFVNEIAQDVVVKDDYTFVFYSAEGDKFVGECISREDYNAYIESFRK